MDDILDVTSGRTEEFENVAIELENLVTKLPISAKQDSQLTYLTLLLIAEAEVGAFRFGIQIMGLALSIADKEERELEEDDLRKAYDLYMLKKEAAEDSEMSK